MNAPAVRSLTIGFLLPLGVSGAAWATGCYVDDRLHDTACDHHVDTTDPEQCPDTFISDSDSCPGVMYAAPGLNSVSASSASCGVSIRAWSEASDPPGCVTIYTGPLKQSCEVPAGEPC